MGANPEPQAPGATNHDDRQSTGSAEPTTLRRAFLCVEVGVALYLVLDILAQVLPPHYSAIKNPESDLAVGPYGWIMTLNFVNRGIFSLVFLFAFVRAIRRSDGNWGPYRRGVLLIAIWAVGALVLAAFPTDVPATPVSGHGGIHLVAAVLAFLGGALGVLLLSLRFSAGSTLAGARRFALPLAVIAVVLVVVDLGLPFVAPQLAASIGGLTERLFLGSVILWIFLVSHYLRQALDANGPSSQCSTRS